MWFYFGISVIFLIANIIVWILDFNSIEVNYKNILYSIIMILLISLLWPIAIILFFYIYLESESQGD